ncbi:MAG TPA: outer membrane beta-barrel protein, partial [Chloroflexota bacterium]
SGLTNITLDGSRTYEDSPLAQAPLYLASNVGLRVDHELLRNVLLFARVSYEEDAYINLARTDKRPQFELGGGYQMNRWLAWKLDYRHLKSTPVGADAGLGFKDDRVALTLTARL